jgi:hypothetical protein
MLYTEPRFLTPDGWDFGLFCREHAYHVYLVGRMLGLKTQIVIGHFAVATADGRSNCTLGSGADHAWCAIGPLRPLDLSMTFHLTPGYPDLARPLAGTGLNGAYEIRNFTDTTAFRTAIEPAPPAGALYYLEQEVLEPSPASLLQNPFDFLLPPAVPAVHGLTSTVATSLRRSRFTCTR